MSDLLQARINRAENARRLLDSDLLKEAFAKLEVDYIEAWRTSAVTNQDGREKLFLAINVLGKVREHLTHALTDGKMAQLKLKDLLEPPRAA